MVLSYPKPLGLSSASRTFATLPNVSGADSLFNPISSPAGLTGSDINLPNVVQSESRIVNLFTPITASGRVFFHVNNVNERFHHGDGTAGLHADLLRFCPLSHRYARQRKGDNLLPRFDKALVLVKQRALVEHHRTRLCIARLLACEAILMFVKP